jgi:phosphoribosyl-dephospho-CoA transferase
MNEIITQLQQQETKLSEQLDKAEKHANTLRLQLNQIKGAINALTSNVPGSSTSTKKKSANLNKKQTLSLEDIETLMRKTLLAKQQLTKDSLLKELETIFEQDGIPKHGLKAKYEKLLASPRFHQSVEGVVSQSQ